MNHSTVKDFVKNKNNIHAFLLVGFLWLCVWATYNTDVSILFHPGFPHNVLELIHGLRSLLPFLSLIAAIFILFKNRSLPKKFFTTPVGLLSIFTIIGVISSVFSKNPLMAFYWGILYGTVIVVLLTILDNRDLLKKIIKINCIIAGIIAIGLTLVFLIQPGAVKSLTFNFLICSQRPYEGLGGVAAQTNRFGMPETRPTGLGRYAGFVSVIALAGFLCSKKRSKIVWLLLFLVFLSILLFSKGRTEIMAFIVAMIFAILLVKKINIPLVLGVCIVCMLSFFIIFYNIPCSNSFGSMAYFLPNISFGHPSAPKNVISEDLLNISTLKSATDSKSRILNTSTSKSATATGLETLNTSDSKSATASESEPTARNIESVITLSGRTSGVWSDSLHLFWAVL